MDIAPAYNHIGAVANPAREERLTYPAQTPGMTRLRRIVPVAAITGLLLLLARCSDSNGDTIEPGDLVGTWRAATGVTLTFQSGSAGQGYDLRDPQGAYSDLHEGGDDLLAQGYWDVAGTSLTLIDEAGPVACPSSSDRFVILMNDAKTIMTLSHLGDECLLRASILADHTWQKQTDES